MRLTPSRVAAVALAMIPLAACATEPAPLAELAEDMPGQVEPVYAAAIARDQAIFWVTSNGCTEKGDLRPIVVWADTGAVITLRRIKDDRCRSPQPSGLEVRWTFDELGLPAGSSLSVQNPAQVAIPAV